MALGVQVGPDKPSASPMMTYDCTVVGGGPAGSIAATVLARGGLSVCLIEKDYFPRHKLCGEFLSGDGVDVLRSLQLDRAVVDRGAIPVRRCVVTSSAGARFEAPLPGQPLSISRYAFDLTLFEEARRSGAIAMCGTAVTNVDGSLGRGFEVSLDGRAIASRAVVLAHGRSSLLDRKIGLAAAGRRAKNPLVAFKAHYEGRHDPETVELHAFTGGYCGIQPVEQGRINVCWITGADTLRAAGGRPEKMIRSTFEENALLAGRVAALQRTSDRFLAVGQLNLRPRKAVAGDLLLAGDAAGMIAPMCGDGMSMAMTAGLAAGRLMEAFLRGSIDAEQLRNQYRRAWRRAFRRRMWLGHVLHRGYEHRLIADGAVRICSRLPKVAEWLIHATRS